MLPRFIDQSRTLCSPATPGCKALLPNRALLASRAIILFAGSKEVGLLSVHGTDFQKMNSGLGIGELWPVDAFQAGEGGLNQDACILTGVGEGDGLCRMILRFVVLKWIGANIYPQSGTYGFRCLSLLAARTV